MATEETITTSRPWNTFENRCDACGSESFYRFERILGDEEALNVQQFHFCGHHGNRHKAALTEQGWTADDFTHLINPAPSISANV